MGAENGEIRLVRTVSLRATEPDVAAAVGSDGAGVRVTGVLVEQAPFAIAIFTCTIVGVPLLVWLGRGSTIPIAAAYRIPLAVASVYLPLSFVCVLAQHTLIGGRSARQGSVWQEVLSAWLPAHRFGSVVLVLLLLPAFLALMLSFRTAITTFQPFAWDAQFMELDRLIHAGRHPWELLQPLLGSPTVTRLLDGFYVYGWFLMLWMGVAWQTVHGREPIRSQFLLAFVLCWIVLGWGAATALSSAGPVYFGRVTAGHDPYEPLMVYLTSIDSPALKAVAVQEQLWRQYRDWGGITAMPSMHVAQATLVVVAAVRSHRWLAYPAVPALVLILMGSVHLGWHYAVDSYAGLVGAVLLWWVAGRVVRWWRGKTGGADPMVTA